MVERNFNSSINTQINTINNSQTMRTKCGWWEKEEGAKVPMNGTCKEFGLTQGGVLNGMKCNTSSKNSLVKRNEMQHSQRKLTGTTVLRQGIPRLLVAVYSYIFLR